MLTAILIITLVIFLFYFAPHIPRFFGKSIYKLGRELKTGYKEEKDHWKKNKLKEELKDEIKEELKDEDNN